LIAIVFGGYPPVPEILRDIIMPYEIIISERLCHGCNDCVIACPKTTLCKDDPENMIMIVKDGKARIINNELCDGCGMCIEACPVRAIRIIVPAQSKG
jgi:4Fe-4S ferredoxin